MISTHVSASLYRNARLEKSLCVQMQDGVYVWQGKWDLYVCHDTEMYMCVKIKVLTCMSM